MVRHNCRQQTTECLAGCLPVRRNAATHAAAVPAGWAVRQAPGYAFLKVPMQRARARLSGQGRRVQALAQEVDRLRKQLADKTREAAELKARCNSGALQKSAHSAAATALEKRAREVQVQPPFEPVGACGRQRCWGSQDALQPMPCALAAGPAWDRCRYAHPSR